MLPGTLQAVTLVASCAAWHPAATGFYPGTVESAGPKAIDTWIELAPDGRLQGRYVLHEPERDVPGTLAPLADEDCHVAYFQWTDTYGGGLVRLQFDEVHHCFDGTWGAGLTVDPDLTWHTCLREKPVS